MTPRHASLAIAFGLLGTACHLGRSEKPSPPMPQTKFQYDADSVCTASSPRWLPSVRASDNLNGPGKFDSPERWAYWARRVPGGWAGGPFYPWPTMGATATIFLRDTTLEEAALAALDTLVPADVRRGMHAVPISVRRVRWDAAELYDWRQFIAANFRSAKGVEISAWGIRLDGLTIGIASRSMLLPTIEWLHDLDVPCGLVTVEVMGRWVALTASSTVKR